MEVKMSKLAIGIVVALSACSATKRSPQMYRADTQKVLETRMGQMESCYAEALKADATIGGQVTVKLVVEKKTGKLTNVTIDPTASAAPEPVRLCVINSLSGLALAPPDANEGQATFVFELRPKPS
jgi:hypothetical protein